jgi:hypothetical protein
MIAALRRIVARVGAQLDFVKNIQKNAGAYKAIHEPKASRMLSKTKLCGYTAGRAL